MLLKKILHVASARVAKVYGIDPEKLNSQQDRLLMTPYDGLDDGR